jgi:hypothetical protein
MILSVTISKIGVSHLAYATVIVGSEGYFIGFSE